MRRTVLFAVATLAALGMTTVTATITPAQAQETASIWRPNVTATGTGEISVTPDIARITVGVQVNNKDSAVAGRENAAKTDAIIKAIKALGVADKDIQTANYSINPQFDYTNPQAPKLNYYQVTNSVRITIRKVADAGKALDAALQAGANVANGIEFDVSDPQKAQDEALAQAVADATHKARVAAKAAGISRLSIAQITIADAPQPPRPIFMAMKSRNDPSTPIEAGEQKITATVSVLFQVVGDQPIITP